MKAIKVGIMAAVFLLSGMQSFAANPLNLGKNLFTADPSPHVWKDGKLYVYTSHDEECQKDFYMKDWYAFSTTDLVNWENHGPVMNVKDTKWADNFAWAPDAAYKNGKYYFIFPAGTGDKNREDPKKGNKWMGIGIAESDSPTGPFKDMIGAPLWTKPYANDPALFIDDDGKTYLYFHGANFDYHVVEMADDMRSVKGDFIKMDMGGKEPKMEGPWVFKRNGMYYYVIPEGNRDLAYFMSKSPTGPWQYKGIFMERESPNNNHPGIVEYKGQWILFYHRHMDVAGSACEKKKRHVSAEFLYFNEDGTIKKVNYTTEGVSDFINRVPKESKYFWPLSLFF